MVEFSEFCPIIIYNAVKYAVACFDRRKVCIKKSLSVTTGISLTFMQTNGGVRMAVSYKRRLWKLLIDKDMKRSELCRLADISTASVTKMGRNGCVTTDVLDKICTALDCNIEERLWRLLKSR